MGQYGGMQGAVERYKELMTLPEAAALSKGVSIDGYSVFGAGLRGRFGGVFHVPNDRLFFVPGTKGGGGT